MNRDLDAVKQEFLQVCARAGNAAYTIEQLKQEIAALHSKMSDLNAEATALTDAPKEEVNETPSEG